MFVREFNVNGKCFKRQFHVNYTVQYDIGFLKLFAQQMFKQTIFFQSINIDERQRWRRWQCTFNNKQSFQIKGKLNDKDRTEEKAPLFEETKKNWPSNFLMILFDNIIEMLIIYFKVNCLRFFSF